MAKAGPWYISSGFAFSAYSLYFGYGIIPLPADQSRPGKTYDRHDVFPSGVDRDTAHKLTFRAASVSCKSLHPRITHTSGQTTCSTRIGLHGTRDPRSRRLDDFR